MCFRFINTHKCLAVFREAGNETDQMDVEDAVRDALQIFYIVKNKWIALTICPPCTFIWTQWGNIA